MRFRKLDILISSCLLLVILITSGFLSAGVYRLNLFPVEFQGIVIFFLFIGIFISLSIIIGRVIHFYSPLSTGEIDLNEKRMETTVWKTLGFLNLFNVGLLINTAICPVSLRGFIFRLIGSRVGKFSMIGGKIIEPFMVTLGDDVILGEDSLVLGHIISANKLYLGKVLIGNNVTIGVKAVVMPDVVIEDGAVVGASSLVVRGTRIKAGEHWVGTPARKM